MNHEKVLPFRFSSKSAVLISGIILGLVFVFFASFLAHQHMEETKKQRLDHLKQVVQIARNSIEPILVEYRNKTVSKEEALEKIRNLVRRMIYEDFTGENYIFMSSYDGTMLVQPFEPDKEMTSVWDLKDFNGVYIIRALIDAAKSKDEQGYVSYHYQRPGQTSAEEKISFVIGIPELDCYIGTGQYVSDIRKSQFYYVAKIACLTALLLLLLLFLVWAAVKEFRTQNALLRKAERELSAIFNNTYQFIGTLSPDGILTKINLPALKFIDQDEDSVIGRPFWDTPWWQDDAMKQRLEKAVADCANGAFCRFEATHMRSDQEKVFIDFTLSPIFDENEDVVFLLAEGRDMTDRVKAIEHNKNLEKMLSQSQKMESLGTLAGGIAHDFNNIIAAILGYTELVLRDSDMRPKNRKKLEQVLAAAKRARELVKQILMFSRKGQEQREYVKIGSIVEETTQLLRNTIPKSVAINLDVETEVGTVLADSTQIHQVIMNLCTNAYHAMLEEAGEITISLRQVNVDFMMSAEYPNLRQGEYALLSVSDTGVGIPPDVMARIFEPFYTTKKQGKGTGMGLAVVHGIIQSHDGAIGVESTVGKGTTFKIFLPLVEEPIDSVSTEEGTADLQGTERILFVDDETMLMELGKETLESLGYQVTAETSGEAALARFSVKSDDFDLIITDQTMPEMTGEVFAKRSLLIRPDIPIIICTGHSTLLDTEKAKAIGIKALLMKPVEGDVLAMEVRKALDGVTVS